MALVHEAWLRLADASAEWQDRSHFLRTAATAMRRILVDRARAKVAAKRGGNARRVELGDLAGPERDADLLALDEALGKLAEEKPDHAKLVELRYFAGLSGDEAAAALGVSPATADRLWRFARAWLQVELKQRDGSHGCADRLVDWYRMSDVTHILNAIDAGDPRAADRLFPLVYDELRRLAARKLAHEKPGQTLDATGLVHEAYLRLIGDQQFENRRHFFAAAAEAMRRILVENARRKKRHKHGGKLVRAPIDVADMPAGARDDDLLILNEALARLQAVAPRKAELVKLRYFAGFALTEIAPILGISQSTAEADWTYAKAWLKRELEKM